jgi:predicted AAA+ superfamily ATPase
MSFTHIITGAKGVGKTTFIKSLIKKVKSNHCLLIYDINNEYADLYPYPFEDFEDFTFKATQVKNAVIIFEEATIFLNNKGSNNDLKKILVRSRHTNNTVFLIFHSVRSIPRYIYELANYITIFRTNDSPDMTARELKDHRLEDVMHNVNNSENIHESFTLKIY